MSDATTAAPAAPAPTPPDATSAAPAAPAAPAAAPAAPTDWTAGFDAASRSFVQSRFKAPGELMAALQSFDPPESPDKYELPVPEGDTGDFAKKVAPILHSAKLSPAQAKALAEGWNALNAQEKQAATQAQEAAEREAQAVAQRQQSELKAEWGSQFDAKVETARRAIRAGMSAAGIAEDQAASMIDTLEKSHGFAAVHKFFAALGSQFTEARAHGMGQRPAMPARSFYDKSNMNP